MPEARYYLDFSGTGNSLNASNPEVARLIADSLRYWVGEMHVDGFRFDLASTLGRVGRGEFSRHGAALPDPQPGPGAVARQAHRRALGHRHGRLSGRQLPGRRFESGTASFATRSGATGKATRTWPPRSAIA